ncbi:MAG: biopolymer transporter ExbD [Lysobacter sp.]|nr:biopolymer transporter ExbD [Lysobacter sp.]
MAFASDTTHRGIAEMNITPLVDVMLVLLVIFMVAAPVLTHRIPLDLPQAGPQSPASPTGIDLRIDAAGEVFWNGTPTSFAALPARLATATQVDEARMPALRIDASADADYGAVARVLAMARDAGIARIGFVRHR